MLARETLALALHPVWSISSWLSLDLHFSSGQLGYLTMTNKRRNGELLVRLSETFVSLLPSIPQGQYSRYSNVLSSWMSHAEQNVREPLSLP